MAMTILRDRDLGGIFADFSVQSRALMFTPVYGIWKPLWNPDPVQSG